MVWFFARLLHVRWALALRIAHRVALELHKANGRLEPEERARLAELIKHSRGRIQRMSRGERREAVRLSLKAVGRQS